LTWPSTNQPLAAQPQASGRANTGEVLRNVERVCAICLAVNLRVLRRFDVQRVSIAEPPSPPGSGSTEVTVVSGHTSIGAGLLGQVEGPRNVGPGVLRNVEQVCATSSRGTAQRQAGVLRSGVARNAQCQAGRLK
jgi:hypothetical protein